MSVSSKFKSDYHISQRREAEFKEAQLKNAINGDKNVFLKARWEAKSDNLIKNQIVRNRVTDMRRRQATDLNQRKQKLAALLAYEDAMYEKEFQDNLETPEQVRAKMAERLNEIKVQREDERQQQVQQALDRKFKMETDDLRKEETQFMVAGCNIEREKQLMDKKAKLEQQIVEEQVYAKLWMLDHDKKVHREKTEAAEKKKKIHETVNILTWQNENKVRDAEVTREKKMREQEMLKHQWAREVAADHEADRQKFVLNRERNLEIIQHNVAERELNRIQQEAEKQRDKELLADALAREKALEQIEEAERQARRKEVIELQQYYKQSASDKQAYEKLVDEFVQQEAERQYKMREAQWHREEQARINLLKDVYNSREQDILLKQQKRKEFQWYKDYERKQIETAIAQQNAEFEARAAREAAGRKNHQMDILKQMNEKDRIQRTFLQEKMYEERAAKLAELEYQRKINHDKMQNQTMLSEWKASVQY